MIKNDLTFDFLKKEAPPTVRGYVDRLKDVPQSTEWHPEGQLETHTRIVLNRARMFEDTDLILTAFFHDLGKVDTTKSNGKGGFSAHDHEDISARLVKYSRGWIKSLGGNPDIVEWLVSNHMRYKHLDEMKTKKSNELIRHPNFRKLCEFGVCDSREYLDVLEVIIARGNPFKFLFNKLKTYFQN